MHGLPDEPFLVPPQFSEAITLAPRVRVPFTQSPAVDAAEIEVVAVPRADGSACLVDAFLDPACDPRPALGDPVFLDGLKAALARLGLPAGSLAYADEEAQDEHCVAFEAGADLAGAVLALIGALEAEPPLDHLDVVELSIVSATSNARYCQATGSA